MNVDEAREWLEGNRSWTNLMHDIEPDPALREVRAAQMDAATRESAYWIVRAHDEGLIE